MSNFKERLTEEHIALTEKINKLEDFILDEKFKTIDPIQQSLLKVQFQSMQTYNQCLIERIASL